MKQNKTYRLLAAGFFIIFIIAVGMLAYCNSDLFKAGSIYGQSGTYIITVKGSDNIAIQGAQIEILDPSGSGEWLNMGQTNNYGQCIFSGWEGITVQAKYNSLSGSGTLPNQPQSLTLILPMAGNSIPSTTSAPQTVYSFNLDVSPRESGIIGVEGGGSTSIQSGYPAGTTITLTANPVTPYVFTDFIVNGQHKTQNPYTFTISGATTVLVNFKDTTPTAAPIQQTCNLYIDSDLTNKQVAIGETTWFTISTTPAIADQTATLHAYIDDEEVAFSGVQGVQTSSNGMALISVLPSSVTAIYGSNTVTWKATVNGITSNPVTTVINPQSTVNPDYTPPPTDQPNENTAAANAPWYQGIIDFFSFKWLTDLFKW